MKIPTKKKIAKEILILFGALGATLLVTVIIWCYSLIIDNKIDNRIELIRTHQAELSNISKVYADKISKIKTFVCSLKQKEDEHWGSSFTLFLASKEMKVNKAIKKYEADQAINGTLPHSSDTLSYYNCFKSLKNIRLPKGFVLTDVPDTDALTIWNCLLTNKENLFYFLPLTFLEEYKIETRSELFNLLKQYNLNNDELKAVTQIKNRNAQIIQLQKEKNILSDKAINNRDFLRLIVTILIFILVLVYPLRFLYLIFWWAFKTYRRP